MLYLTFAVFLALGVLAFSGRALGLRRVKKRRPAPTHSNVSHIGMFCTLASDATASFV